MHVLKTYKAPNIKKFNETGLKKETTCPNYEIVDTSMVTYL
jgi:hypothetical protein